MLYLTVDHCRAIDGDRVCGLLGSKCTRLNHKDSAKSPPGEYGNLGPLRANSALPDGDPGVFMSEDDLFARESDRAALQLAENANVGAQESVQAGYRASPLRSDRELDDEIKTIAPALHQQAAGMFKNVATLTKRVLNTPQAKSIPGISRLAKATEDRRQLEQQVEATRRQVELQEAAATQADAQARAAAQAQAQAQAQAAAEAREAASVEATIQKLRLELAALEARKSNIGRSPTVTFEDASPPPPVRPMGPPSMAGTERAAPTGTQLGRIPGGQDPGYKDDTIFGIPKVSEEEVFEQLIPPNLPADIKSELQTLLPDVVSPALGTFATASESGQEDMTAGFLNALENHSNVVQNRRGGFVKPDASWNTINRVGLYKVKSASDFKKLHHGYSIRERDFALRFGNRVRSVLLHYGYSRADSQYFAESSRYSLMCTRAHDLYGRLLSHLEREIAQAGFKSVKPIIDLFAIDLVGFRDDVSRLSMWFHTYVYLRNLFQQKFWSLERQEIINRSVWALGSGADDGNKLSDDGGGPGGKCNHCQAHPGNNCPFHSAGISRNVSRKLGKKAKALGGRFGAAAKKVIAEHEDETGENEEGEEEGTGKKKPP